MRMQYLRVFEFKIFGEVFEINSESGATKTCQSRTMFPAESSPLPWLQVFVQQLSSLIRSLPV